MTATAKRTTEQAYEHETLGFGVPATIAPHHFLVQIPRGNRSAVRIEEDLGLEGKSSDEVIIPRAEVRRPHWTSIKGPVKRIFNARLKEHGLRTSQFKVGENKVDRLLGKEICLLAWAIQDATDQQIPISLRNWLALKPEERWWMFGMTAASAGSPNNPGEGWRMAVQYLMTDRFIGSQPMVPKPRPAVPTAPSLGLFDPESTEQKDR